jgi:hypothetical protein
MIVEDVIRSRFENDGRHWRHSVEVDGVIKARPIDGMLSETFWITWDLKLLKRGFEDPVAGDKQRHFVGNYKSQNWLQEAGNLSSKVKKENKRQNMVGQ